IKFRLRGLLSGAGGGNPTWNLQSNVAVNSVVANKNLSVLSYKNGYSGTNHKYRLELSDSLGNFNSPIVLADSVSNLNSYHTVKIPGSVESGSNYRVRAVSFVQYY